jgi:hypothetical protein
MSIFDDNIRAELPLETVLGVKFNKAVDDAVYEYRYSYNVHASLERVVKNKICDVFEPMFIFNKHYKLIDSDTIVTYNHLRVRVTFLIKLKDNYETDPEKQYKTFELNKDYDFRKLE